MIGDLLITVMSCILIIATGCALLSALYSKPLNGYIRFGFSFILGNLSWILLLTLLASMNLLDLAPVFFVLSGVGISYYWGQVLYGRYKKNKRLWFHIARDDQLLILSVLVTLLLVLGFELCMPIDLWDARAIWLMKARTFFVEDGFKSVYLVSDHFRSALKAYPNGYSLMLAFLSRLAGNMNEHALKIYLFMNFMSVVSALLGMFKYIFSSVKWHIILLLLVAILLSTKITLYALSGYADISLSLGILGSVVCMILALRSSTAEDCARLLFIGNLSALFALNIKNEGLPFFIIYLVLSMILFIMQERIKGIVEVWKNRRKMVIGFATALVVSVCIFGVWILVRNSAGITSEMPVVLADRTAPESISRILIIFRAFVTELLRIDRWSVLLFPIFVLVGGVGGTLLFGRKTRKYAIPSVMLFCQLGIYAITYFYTKFDLNWHLMTSLERLYIHLIPSMLCVAMYYIGLNMNNDSSEQ